MKFGEIPMGEAQGAILAHTLRIELPGKRVVFKKGRVLGAADVAILAEAGYASVIAAVLDAGDVAEDKAAAAIGRAAAGHLVRVEEAATGRCNLFAEAAGITIIDRERVDAINAIHESATVATVPAFRVVAAGDMVATVKIIPFAAERSVVDACVFAAAGGIVSVAAFRPFRAAMVLTELPGVAASILDRAVANMRTRIAALGGELAVEIRCGHSVAAVRDAVLRCAGTSAPILVLGASAIVDRHDVVPQGIVAAGGVIDHFGMPVDPGNLLLLAHRGDTPVIGVPGCARSLKPSGMDWVLQRIVAGVPITGKDLMAMGTGGLLDEGAARPAPRLGQGTRDRPVVCGLLLAAGRSQRMGAQNKLLVEVDGMPMVARAADALLASPVSSVVAVTGHQAAEVRAALSDRRVFFVHNPEYAEGMSTSLAAGIAAIEAHADAAVICLGDMPWVQSEHIRALIAAYNPVEGREICVPVHQGKRGNPVLLGARFFAEMKAVRGDVGARQIIQQHAEFVHEVPVLDTGVIVDIDTVEALDALTRKTQ